MDLATKGEKALADSQAALAVQYYTRALLELPRAPNYYIQRSTAYSRLKPEDGGPKSDAALRDAEIAVTLAADRGSRELILSAQFRRAVSLFQLERYGDASFLLQMLDTKVNGQKEKMDRNAQVRNAMSASGPSSKHRLEAHVPVWIAKVNKKLGELADGDEKAAVSIVEYPKTKPLSKEELQAELSGKTQATVEKEEHTAAPAPTRSLPERTDKATTPTASVALEKIRHEWYQSTDSVVVTLYVKGVPKDRVQSELKDETISLQFPLPSGADYDFTLDPLFAPINPSTSKVTVMGTKIEITLQKQNPGHKWRSLEGSSESTQLADRPVAPTAPSGSGPAYPTSSRHGAKDWDKVASSLSSKKHKEKKTGDTEDGGDASDAESTGSEFGGDAVDGFFKKLYAGADPDTRRAMIKSYVESQGTSLSTNWSEVGTKTMEPHKD